MATETVEKYCPICGKPVADPTYNRFGKWCCSAAHAEEYVKEVRPRRQQAVAPAAPPSGYEEAPRQTWFGRRRGGC